MHQSVNYQFKLLIYVEYLGRTKRTLESGTRKLQFDEKDTAMLMLKKKVIKRN